MSAERKITSAADVFHRPCTICLVNGCFDLLHAGHVRRLEAARELADHLVVVLNSDASVRLLKGDSRPIVPEADRALMLAALECVDAVVISGPAPDVAAEIAAIRPHVYAGGWDHQHSQNPAERAALEACGARTVWQPATPGISTSAIVQRIQGEGRA
jgi:rfaE bifunctional protein nucleotidyltransferase chain/domain